MSPALFFATYIHLIIVKAYVYLMRGFGKYSFSTVIGNVRCKSKCISCGGIKRNIGYSEGDIVSTVSCTIGTRCTYLPPAIMLLKTVLEEEQVSSPLASSSFCCFQEPSKIHFDSMSQHIAERGYLRYPRSVQSLSRSRSTIMEATQRDPASLWWVVSGTCTPFSFVDSE